METTLIERNQLGGTCVNDGCVPTKTYLEAIKAKQYLESMGINLKLDPLTLRRACESKISQLGFGAEYVLRKMGSEDPLDVGFPCWRKEGEDGRGRTFDL